MKAPEFIRTDYYDTTYGKTYGVRSGNTHDMGWESPLTSDDAELLREILENGNEEMNVLLDEARGGAGCTIDGVSYRAKFIQESLKGL